MRVDQKIGEARGLLAEALALQESGVLVSGMTVTDLATGFVVTGDAEMQRPGYLQYEGADSAAGATGTASAAGAVSRADAMDDVEFQRSGLSLGRLSELFEMVSEVLEQRQEHPEAAAVNPPEPRELFPWGIGLREVDVLVTGSFAVQVVHYLRIMGVRARLVDNDMVLRVASELALAQQELQHLNLAEPVRLGEVDSGAAEPVEETDEWQEVEEGASIRKEERKDNRRLPAALAALALFIVGGLVATFTVFDSQAAENTVSADGAGSTGSTGITGSTESTASVQGDSSVESEEPVADEPFPEPHRRGVTTADQSSRRADIPISVNVDGWHLGGATRAREEYVGDDEGMRVLVAAKETPLKTQEEMDAAMLGALNDVSAGDSGVTVVSTQPVSYEENYPSSTTLWHVRLVDGHQISVGCQYRQWNEQREKVCQEFVATARPEK
ncbi:type VII secretion-associated protein [Corynebacterium sp. ACRQJ]|uniref:type VII secretion-associated protein n=1 Tax=Corynebacterium sp. ACRQJ TaxID=2918189 RepID=UPI001EF432B6|nr:type VII secretion-associated protein [Corynebacterium sp. ACRQJ]MCG7267671.1 type VII secretion-associated protein [Corynebacterium sp. ACRQJ]